MSKVEAKKLQVACLVPEDVKAALEARCTAEGVSVSSRLADLIKNHLSGPDTEAAPAESLRRELAALAVVFLSARYRVTSTEDAIAVVRAAFLSGDIHQEIQ